VGEEGEGEGERGRGYFIDEVSLVVFFFFFFCERKF
jgi:hypothetical protein